MKKVLLIFAIVLVASCKKTDEPIEMNEPPAIPNVPSCISDIINDPDLSQDLKTVRLVELNNTSHYWLNTDFMEADGVEFIVNNQCDTICSLCGFCVPPACAADYDDVVWTTIWEK